MELEVIEEDQAKAAAGPSVKAPIAASTPPTSFVPRVAARPKTRLGIGAKSNARPAAQSAGQPGPSADKQNGTLDSSSNIAGSRNQEAFRAMLTGKK